MAYPEYLIDFETRSQVDLKACGAHIYAASDTTSVLCLSWIDLHDRTHRGCWRGWPENEPAPQHLFGADLFAWNAQFEQQVWNRVCARMGWPALNPDKIHCIMKMSAHAGMPLGLDAATVAAGIIAEKDMVGHRMMLKWCKPLPARKAEPDVIRWADDPAEYEVLCSYADRDCDAEIAMLDLLRGGHSAFEEQVMRIDRRINDRGFKVDTEAAVGAAAIARQEVKRLNGEMSRLTNGRITTCNQRQRILDMAAEHGVSLPNMQAGTVRDTLAGEVDEGAEHDLVEIDMPPIIRRILELRVEAGMASVAKFMAFVRGAGSGGRFRGAFAYGGAATTLRFAGRRVQAQNFPRDSLPDGVDEEMVFDALATGDREYFASLLPEGTTVMAGLKTMVRGMIVP